MSTLRSAITRAFALAAFAALATQAVAAQAPATQSAALPPIRPLSKVTAASTELLGAVSQVRALPGGRVLVNDNLGRKVVLFERGLGSYKVVADTTSATANAYSSRAGGLIAYKGDSTLFVDPVSLSMLVIDGKGDVARVISVPRPNEAGSLIGGPNGTPGFDAQGRLVYRAPPNFRIAPPAPGANGPQFQMPQFPDSVAVVRIALDTRKVDTVAFIKIPKQNMQMTQRPDGGMSFTSTINPMQVVDDWAVTADGRVAIVRGMEYRIDWVDGNGAVAASNKVPFAWRHLDDSTKSAFIDSTKKAMETLRQQALARAQAGGAGPIAFGPGGAAAADIGAMAGMRIEMSVRGGDGGGRGAAPAAANGAPAAGGPSNIQIPPLNFVSPSELPDYAPPFTAGAVRGDLDGNVWIRTSNVYSGGSVYDIVNAKGELTDRVLLPAGRVIAGFGPGVVYMGFRDGAGVRLEMAPIRQATP
jgi:hypothetical protein